MAHESVGVVIRLLLTFRRHRRRSDFQRFARVQVAGFAPVHNVGVGHVDLNDLRIPLRRLPLKTINLLRRKVDHVVGDVFIQLGLGRRHRLQHIAQVQAFFRALIPDLVVCLLQLRKIELFLAAVRKLDRCLLLLVLGQFVLLAGSRRRTCARLNFIAEGIHVGAPVGEHALHGEQPGRYFVDCLTRFFSLRLRILIGLVVSLLEGGVIRILLDVLLRRSRFRPRRIQKRAVAILPLLLESFPRTLAPRLVPQGPEQRRHQNHRRDQVIRGIRFTCDRVLLGVGLFRHRFLRKCMSSKSACHSERSEEPAVLARIPAHRALQSSNIEPGRNPHILDVPHKPQPHL